MKLQKLQAITKGKLTKEAMSQTFGGHTVCGTNCNFTGNIGHDCADGSYD